MRFPWNNSEENRGEERRVTGGFLSVQGLQWVSILTGVLVFALVSLGISLLIPVPKATHPSHAPPNPLRIVLVVDGIAAVLAILIAPYLLRLFDQLQQRLMRQNAELKSLHAIDNAINTELRLDGILAVAVREATVAMDAEVGLLRLFGFGETPDAQAVYNVSAGLQAILRDTPPPPDWDTVRRTGLPARRHGLESVWRSERFAAVLRWRNVLTVPIGRQDEVFGVLTIANRGGTLNSAQGFTTEDQELMEKVAATVAVAIHNARLYDEMQRRGETLRSLVARTGEAIEASSDAPRLMQLLADEAARILRCPRVAVYACDGNQAMFVPLAVYTAAEDAPEFHAHSLKLDPLRTPLARSGARYFPHVGDALGLSESEAPYLARPGFAYLLRTRDRQLLGMLCLLDNTPRPPSSEATDFATALSAQASIALENARLYAELKDSYTREKHIAETFQRSLLTPIAPRIGVFEFAHEYQAGLAEASIGGDFYDLFPLGQTRVGVVMADVSGKGLKAAMQTATVKYMLRGFASETPETPGVALKRVNEALCSTTDTFDGFVTLFFGVLDTATGDFAYANGGHESPLRACAATGEVRPLEACDGIALGCMTGFPYAECQTRLEPGDLLLLHTDGLTEARDPERQFLGQGGLLQMMPRSADSADAALQTLFAQVQTYADHNLGDDAALLMLRRVPE